MAVLPFAANANEGEVQGRIVVQSEVAVAQQVGRSLNNIPIKLIETRHLVAVEDVDLTTPAGADALLKRVRTVARKGCAQLDSMLPYSNADRSCVRDAIKDATPQVEAAIAEANGKARPSAQIASSRP